jgi:hypothetical protein
MYEGGEGVAKDIEEPIIEVETVEAVKSAMEVEVLADNEPAPASTSSFDEKHDLSIYEGPLAGSVRVQYQPTLSLFEFLLEERSSAAEAKSPIDAQVEEKVSALGLLQAELGHCTAALMSEKRQRWLADKAALEEQKRACKAKWAELQARHAEAADAWKALADKAEEGSKQARPPRQERGTSALVASQDGVAVPRIFAKTSPKAQIALLTEQVALSEEQRVIDATDEALMADALQLYQDEQAARERREQIVAQQQTILAELQALVEDKGTYGGHKAFVADGFEEGRAY